MANTKTSVAALSAAGRIPRGELAVRCIAWLGAWATLCRAQAVHTHSVVDLSIECLRVIAMHHSIQKDVGAIREEDELSGRM